MAFNIYHEAGNQSMIGQMAVGQVVLNRVADDRFPDTVCEVVKEAVTYKNTNKPVRWKCQFNLWFCDGKKDEPDFESKTWSLALENASILLTKTITLDITEERLTTMQRMCVRHGQRLRLGRHELINIFFTDGRNKYDRSTD